MLGMAVRLGLLGGDRGGISVPVAWPLCRFYNECFSSPVPLIRFIFQILEIFFSCCVSLQRESLK